MFQAMKALLDSHHDVGYNGEENQRIVSRHEARHHNAHPIQQGRQQEVKEPENVCMLPHAGCVRLPPQPLQLR